MKDDDINGCALLIGIFLIIGAIILGKMHLAREEGSSAYRKGQSEAANPWKEYQDRKAWIDGYEAEKARDKADK